MTFGVRNIVGILALSRGGKASDALFFRHSGWPAWLATAYDLLLGYHLGHLLELAVAVVFYLCLFPYTLAQARAFGYAPGWVSVIILYDVLIPLCAFSFWHWLTYSGPTAQPLKPFKYNPNAQYSSQPLPGVTAPAGVVLGSAALEREVFHTTLGLLVSAVLHVWFTRFLAQGSLPFLEDFSGPYLLWNIACVLLGGLWREAHFYVVHRGMHPWWDRRFGIKQGDLGAFFYRWCHSLHHASYNPGPFSGLSMHPVEHVVYYSCCLLPLLLAPLMPCSPLLFLYIKFHADIAPIGGHDGYSAPGVGGDFHWLHHAKYECNYGCPIVPLDRLFGTWVDYKQVQAVGYSKAKASAWGLPISGEKE